MFAPGNQERYLSDLDRAKNIAAGIRAEGITAVLRGMKNRPSRVHLMEEGLVPCLWILGALDNYIKFDSVKSSVKLPGNARLVVLQNSGHLGFIEERVKSVKAVSDFIHEKVHSS
jgi:pimeloyl-ACP methyl ester carboxylesterase